jgi:hypothetical protein
VIPPDCDGDFVAAEAVVLVMDNLNTHTVGSLYKRFPPDKTREYVKRLEIHHTPKHGSWLNVAEIEWSILTQQCLNRRIGDIETYHGMANRQKRRRKRHRLAIHHRRRTRQIIPPNVNKLVFPKK